MAPLGIGQKIKSRYRIDSFIGRGGMAEVYRVFDTQRGVDLAMKLLREDLTVGRINIKRSPEETQNLTKSQSPNNRKYVEGILNRSKKCPRF